MKKIVVMALAILLSFRGVASAFEFVEIPSEIPAVNIQQDGIESDKQYLRGIADKYAELYVVEEKESVDISDIERFYTELSEPLTVEELDDGKVNLDLSVVQDGILKNNMNLFKVMGGLSGYKAEFKPIMYFNIYRDITLVGGYSCYTTTYQNPDDASWMFITGVQDITKEKLSYNTRINLFEKGKTLKTFIEGDDRFKIFLLKNGKIDSVWERDDVEKTQ